MLNIIGIALTPLISGAIDAAGQALGFPPSLTAAAKVGVGIFTANPGLVLDGSAQMFGELARNPPARTEYHPPAAGQGGAAGRPPGYAEPRHTPAGASPAGGSSWGTGGPASSPLPGDFGQYREHLRTLQANFAHFDGLVSPDGILQRDELARMAANPSADPKLRDAARFLLQNEHYLNRLDRAAQEAWLRDPLATPRSLWVPAQDGQISRLDLSFELGRVDDLIRQYGLPAAPRPPSGSGSTSGTGSTGGAGSTPGGGSTSGSGSTPGSGSTSGSGSSSSSGRTTAKDDVARIIKDKDLSLEQKLQRILSSLVSRVDEQILATMQDLSEAIDQQGTANRDDKKGQLKADQEVQEIQLRLQDLQEQKERLNQLMSTYSRKYHEMAMVSLQNMAR
jgi:hypothetical protein